MFCHLHGYLLACFYKIHFKFLTFHFYFTTFHLHFICAKNTNHQVKRSWGQIWNLETAEPQEVLIKGEAVVQVFCEKGILKIWSKFTREQPCQSLFSIKLLCNMFSEQLFLITFLEGFSYERLYNVL